MRAPLPRRDWRKVVAATQGITLTIAAAGVVPPTLTRAALAAALALLAESFGRDVWWLWRHRHARRAGRRRRRDRGTAARGPPSSRSSPSCVVWVALVAPNQPSLLTPGAFVRLPLEGIVVVALALVLPGDRPAPPGLGGRTRARPAGHREAPRPRLLRRPSTGRSTPSTTGATRRSASRRCATRSAGRTRTCALAGAALLRVAALVLPTLAVLRLTRVAARHRRRSLRAVAALGAVWVLCWAFGAELVSGAASPPRAPRTWPSRRCARCRPACGTSARFADADPPRPLPRHARRPAADRPARQGRPARVRRELREGRGPGLLVLAAGRRRPRLRGRSSCKPPASRPEAAGSPRRRSAAPAGWRTPRCSRGPGSTASGRYDQLVASDRLTLSQAFERAGWRADRRRAVERPVPGRRGRRSTTTTRSTTGATSATTARRTRTPPCPTSTSSLALQRLELAKARRPPGLRRGRPGVEPHAVDAHPAAHRLERGRRRLDLQPAPGRRVRPERRQRRATAGRSSTRCAPCSPSWSTTAARTWCSSCSATTSPRRSSPDTGASHDVPISVIAHDPAVMRRIAGWGWVDGMRPGPDGAGLADERLPRPLPRRIRLAAGAR